MTSNFYYNTLRHYLDSGKLWPDARILVVGAGALDEEVLSALGFSNVLLTNIMPQYNGRFPYQMEDMENLSFANEDFDFVVEHAALHHCYSPHRGLLEMYRVAKHGCIVFEARDNLLIRLAVWLKIINDYEIYAVVDEGFGSGGVGNSAIPNYVYRWTEREVYKVVASFDPAYRPVIEYFYHLKMHDEILEMHSNTLRKAFLSPAKMLVGVLAAIYPKAANQFAFFVDKAAMRLQPQPWLIASGEALVVDRATLRKELE